MADLTGLGERPSRLPFFIRGIILLLLGISFASGVALWRENITEDISSFPWRRIHGILFAFNCILFGYLLGEHIRYGWKTRTNLVSGVIFEVLFGLLIGTGILLYYGDEDLQALTKQIHLILGLLMPLVLTIHWLSAVRLVKNSKKDIVPRNRVL